MNIIVRLCWPTLFGMARLVGLISRSNKDSTMWSYVLGASSPGCQAPCLSLCVVLGRVGSVAGCIGDAAPSLCGGLSLPGLRAALLGDLSHCRGLAQVQSGLYEVLAGLSYRGHVNSI